MTTNTTTTTSSLGKKKINVIVTGATGMVGEGTVHECLKSDDVEKVLLINRRESGFGNHPKVKEIIHSDLSNLKEIENQFQGYDSVFYCLGITSIGTSKEDYIKITHDMPIAMANSIIEINNIKSKSDNNITFIYVTAGGTDENGSKFWQKIKGGTENELQRLPLNRSVALRPAFMLPTPGLKRQLWAYNYLSWFYPIGKYFNPNFFMKLEQIGKTMINYSSNIPDKNDKNSIYNNNILEYHDFDILGN